jgi:hypothetical protein
MSARLLGVTEITPRSEGHAVTAADVSADLQRFQDAILTQLEHVGLPTDGVLVELDERRVLLTNLGNAMRQLPARGSDVPHQGAAGHRHPHRGVR